MNVFAVFIALLLILAAGFGLSMLISAHQEKVCFIECAALSWMLGAAYVAVMLPCAGLLCHGLVLQIAVAFPSVLLCWIGVRMLRSNQCRFSLPARTTPVERILCAALFLEFAAAICLQYRTALGWDGLLVWEIKARYAFLNNGIIPIDYFTDASRVASHPDYPLMIPMLETWIYLWLGDCHQSWARVIFPLFYFSTTLVLYVGVSRLTGARWTGLVAALLLFFIPYPVAGPWNLFAGYADLPLAGYCLAALVYFLRYQNEPARAHLVLVSLMAGMMPWIKKEGIVLWICLCAVVVAELVRRKKPVAAILILAPGLMVWSGWKIATVIMHTKLTTDFSPINLQIIGTNLPRLSTSARMLWMEIMNFDHWSLLWIGFPAALGCLIASGRGKAAMQILFCVAVPLLLLSCAFILSTWPYFQSHIRTALPRLVLQVAPMALFSIGLALGRKNRLFREPPRS